MTTVADVMLPVHAHESRLVAKLGPQPILKPLCHLPRAFLLSLSELRLGEEYELRRVVVGTEQMVQVGASFPSNVEQLDDFIRPTCFLYCSELHRALRVDYDPHS